MLTHGLLLLFSKFFLLQQFSFDAADRIAIFVITCFQYYCQAVQICASLAFTLTLSCRLAISLCLSFTSKINELFLLLFTVTDIFTASVCYRASLLSHAYETTMQRFQQWWWVEVVGVLQSEFVLQLWLTYCKNDQGFQVLLNWRISFSSSAPVLNIFFLIYVTFCSTGSFAVSIQVFFNLRVEPPYGVDSGFFKQSEISGD